MRWLIVAAYFGVLLIITSPAIPQSFVPLAHTHSDSLKPRAAPLLDQVRFTGLRRITPAAVAAQIMSHVGDPFDAGKIQNDVRALARLGWFESIQVEARDSTTPFPQSFHAPEQRTLIFHLQEFPFLTKVEYSGSRLLSERQIEKMLEEKKLAPPLGKPADPAALERMAIAIRTNLNELGHPVASVQVRRVEAQDATVAARFEINDGPLLRVRRVNFDGDPELSRTLLQRQMQHIAPWKPFRSLRGKDRYTREAFEEDRQRILNYYQDHGFPQARIGMARVVRMDEPSRRWLPWPHQVTRTGLSVTIPVEAGPFSRFESIEASPALQQAAEERLGKPAIFPDLEKGKPYSATEVEKLRRLWLERIQPKDLKGDSLTYRSVEVRQTLDADKHAVRVTLDLGDSPPNLVGRIEFQGLHRFSDRYMRRRILLREGHLLDERVLEAGLQRLRRTGYFKPVRPEDIHVQMDESTHTANVSIRVEEIGQQRASLVGGHGQFGSTVGIAYTVFDLLNREELLSAQLEGGPESLQIMLGVAKEGIFGTRGSLAFSVFNNVLRPRFRSTRQGPFFTSQSEGITVPWTYPLTTTDSLGVNYTLSRTTSEYSLGIPTGVTAVLPVNVRTKISSRSLGVGWARDTGNERGSLSNAVSGGWLGGGENMLRSSGEYSRIFRDPIFAPGDAWAFRTTFSGAGSYHGQMPFYARLFSGDEMVRGLRTGELGPYRLTSKTSNSGTTTYSAAPAGANLVGGSNAEYRVSLGGGTEAAGFFDLGSGWLFPNWLGPTKPLLLPTTNGVLHGSTGIEFRWTVPRVEVPVRTYYALNVLGFDRSIPLRDKSFFHARKRFSAFGWALGTLF